MAFYLVIKVGNQGGTEKGNGHKDGMPVTMLPDGTRFSEHMKRVYAIIRMHDNMKPLVTEALMPHMENGEIEHVRSMHAQLGERRVFVTGSGCSAKDIFV